MCKVERKIKLVRDESLGSFSWDATRVIIYDKSNKLRENKYKLKAF